ncbi:MAG: MBL fold metallo-hydrolase [Bdellovibrionales bacterium]
MKVTLLGCGSSSGVPNIGNYWGACDPRDPRNRRSRVSVLVEQGDTVLLVDASPDMRAQLLAADVKKLDAVLFTHAHADHCHGIDELRSINWLIKKPVDIYADADTLKELETRFAYIFEGTKPDIFHRPSVTRHLITGPFKVGGISIVPFTQDHGYGTTLGFRFGAFAYSTDVKRLDETAFKILEGIDVWIVDCVREEPHATHSHLAQTLEWIARVKPKRAYFTHMNETLDYATLSAKLPPGVWPGHDGLVIEC